MRTLTLKCKPITEIEAQKLIQSYAEFLNFDYEVKNLDKYTEISIGKNERGLIRLYSSKKGLTIDGTAGKNKKINENIITYLNQVITDKFLEESRITYKNISNEHFEKILREIDEIFLQNTDYSITTIESKSVNIKTEKLIKSKLTKEQFGIQYFVNNTLYVYGFILYIGEEVTNIIARITNTKNIIKNDYLNDIVLKCHQNMLTSCEKECENCKNNCSGNCVAIMRDIHFGEKRRYDCSKLTNYYLPRYGFRYSYEIQSIIENKYLNTIKAFESMNILSIGCGPCTDLFGLINVGEEIGKQIKFTGVDLNENWKGIHEIVKSKITNIETNFVYEDVFSFIDKMTMNNNSLDLNIISFQYVISDMVKHNKQNPDIIRTFFNKLYEKIMIKLPKGAIIIFNDINNKENTKDIYDIFEAMISKKDYSINKYSFSNAENKFMKYGESLNEITVPTYIDESINKYYKPWILCKSAAMVIQKVN